MIIEVTESIYKGILLERVKDKGWKCNLGGQEYLFPYYTSAQAAIDKMFSEAKPVVPQCKDCEELAKIREIVKNHAEWEKDYFTAILVQLELIKDALQDKEYQQAEKRLDDLIAELKA